MGECECGGEARGRGALRRAASYGAGCAIALGLAAPAVAQSSSSLRFFGTGVGQQDRVRIRIDDNAPGPDQSSVLDLGAASFSIDFWIRGRLVDNATANAGGDQEFFDYRWIDGNIVIDRDIWGASDRDWGVSLAGGFVRFGTGRDTINGQDSEHTLEGDSPVLDGTWRHVAVVRDAATGAKSIYVGGVLDIASPPGRSTDDISYPNAGDPSPVTGWGPFIVIGAEKHDAGVAYPSFNGFVDELRFWSIALTPAQIADYACSAIDPATPGLVGYYRFEEGAGQVVASVTPGAPTGELIAGAVGNGQWMLASADPANVAPIPCDECVADVDDGSGTGTPDNSVDISDLLYFLALFDAGDLAADLDDGSSTGTPDGGVDISDLLYYLARFDAGC